MKSTEALNELFLALRARNHQLQKLRSSIKPAVRKNAEKNLKNIEEKITEAMKKTATSSNEKTANSEMRALSRLNLLKEKYAGILNDDSKLEGYVRYTVSGKAQRKIKEPWVDDATICVNGLNNFDKKYVASHHEVLTQFLWLVRKKTIHDLNQHCKNNTTPLDSADESKTGLLFLLATKNEMLSADYLVNLAGLAMPLSENLALTVNYLMGQITDEKIQPLLEAYERDKALNPIQSIANLLDALRDHLVCLTKKGTTTVNESALRALYNRECFLAGILPNPIDSFTITKESVLFALKNQATPQSKPSKNGLFSHQSTDKKTEEIPTNALKK